MNVDCKLYGPPREALGQRRTTVSLNEDATVGDLLDLLVEEAPELTELLFADGDDELAHSIGVLVNKRNISRDQGLDTPLSPDDEVLVTPPVHGG